MFNFEVFLISFSLIFLAELGDKTQLMVINLSAREKSPFWVGLSSSIGISLVAIIGIILGFSASVFIPVFWIDIVGAIIFFIFGILAFKNIKKIQNGLEIEEEETVQDKMQIKIYNKFLLPMLIIFLMEFGDKTQIMTITLSANYLALIEVGLGAIFALSSLCFIGAYLGKFIAKKLPKKWIDLGSGIFFIIMGIIILIEALIIL